MLALLELAGVIALGVIIVKHILPKMEKTAESAIKLEESKKNLPKLPEEKASPLPEEEEPKDIL